MEALRPSKSASSLLIIMTDDAGVNEIVRQAVASIDGSMSRRTLEIQNVPIVDETNAQYIANALRRQATGTGTVRALSLSFLEFSQEAAEVFRKLFALRTWSAAATTFQEITLNGPIGNANGVLLFSGLHDPSVTHLNLLNVGLEGAVGGSILSSLVRNNWRLNTLTCRRLPLGLEGARALQPALRAPHAVAKLSLKRCHLGDDGLSVIVAALGKNSTVKSLALQNNGFTSSGLPHVTRLLQLQRDSLTRIYLCANRGVFDDEENTRDFSSALSKTTKLLVLGMSFCRSPIQALDLILGAVAKSSTLVTLGAWETVSLQPVLESIPKLQSVRHLIVNLDFLDAAVLSYFHRNTSVHFVYAGARRNVKISTGPISIILERNRRLAFAKELVAAEPQTTISLGVWAMGVQQLARDNAGATASYQILREKLVNWRSGPITESPQAVAAVATTTTPTSSSSIVASRTNKRSSLQESTPGCNDDTNDYERLRKQARFDSAPSDTTL
jgi:hypothetical protein